MNTNTNTNTNTLYVCECGEPAPHVIWTGMLLKSLCGSCWRDFRNVMTAVLAALHGSIPAADRGDLFAVVVDKHGDVWRDILDESLGVRGIADRADEVNDAAADCWDDWFAV